MERRANFYIIDCFDPEGSSYSWPNDAKMKVNLLDMVTKCNKFIAEVDFISRFVSCYRILLRTRENIVHMLAHFFNIWRLHFGGWNVRARNGLKNSKLSLSTATSLIQASVAMSNAPCKGVESEENKKREERPTSRQRRKITPENAGYDMPEHFPGHLKLGWSRIVKNRVGR